ncbi:MAG: sugar ABC transporter ATP-binding protein [Anaerolineaceae bacterium]|jgi:ribose transport system ATP-binding protein
METNDKKQIIMMKGISKAFPGVQALDECQLELNEGEVLGLVGENGAGKSTLMKILTGIYKKDSGIIQYFGEEVEDLNPRKAREMGLTIIHQELNLIPHLTVSQNIFIGNELLKKNGMLDEALMAEKSKDILISIGSSINPLSRISSLTVAQQQMVEIARAISYESKVIIMDEPTATISQSEVKVLFQIINQMKEKKIGVIYISHRMEELKKICDRVTVMRDGKCVSTLEMGKTDLQSIISLMVGRETNIEMVVNKPIENKEKVLEVKDLGYRNVIKNVSFDLYRGEILGIAGLVGAGRTEMARLIFGAERSDRGSVIVNGRNWNIKSPYDAVQVGISYLSEDRKKYGLILSKSVEDNIVLASLDNYSNRAGFIDGNLTVRVAKEYIEKLSIKTPEVWTNVKNLSGGSQQKVVVSKWLASDSDIFIFDEPTRGIDVGAKGEVYNLLFDLQGQGKSIILISSELSELLRMCNRIVVMCEGRVTGTVDADKTNQRELMALATRYS